MPTGNPPDVDIDVDVLVLGGGGVLGEAWMSALLAGLAEAADFDARACGGYVGTSAGSIVAAALVAGIDPRERLGALPEQPASTPDAVGEGRTLLRGTLGLAGELGSAAAAPLASLALGSTAGGGALVRRALLRRAPHGRRSLEELVRMIEATGASWDGRLRIVAVELDSGRRVVFGTGETPAVPVGVAVAASCAVPGLFTPISAGGRTYVDGGAWSPTNIDAAAVRSGQRVLCLNPTGSLRQAGVGVARALAGVSRGLAHGEALALRHRGASVTTVNPDQPSALAMGVELMDHRRREQVIAAGLAQGRRLAGEHGLRAVA
jgi:NTE family protein